MVLRRGLRFLRTADEVVGAGIHRSGWPYAFAHLLPLADDRGWLFDDFVEQSFCYRQNPRPHLEPWVGVFHHPPSVPPFDASDNQLEKLFERRVWQRSRPYLRGAIALSQYLADFLAQRLQVEAVAVMHPSEIPAQGWSPDAFRSSRHKWLIQVGWYLRNTRVIFQVPAADGYRKIRLWPPRRHALQWVRDYDERVARHWRQQGTRVERGEVTDYPIVSPARYDRILSQNVVLTELFDASANNVVIECLARNTPLIVNRHPAAVEYLTADYPLYFESPEQVPDLLRPERVLEAHQFMAGLDKSWLSGDAFRDAVERAVARFPSP